MNIDIEEFMNEARLFQKSRASSIGYHVFCLLHSDRRMFCSFPRTTTQHVANCTMTGSAACSCTGMVENIADSANVLHISRLLNFTGSDIQTAANDVVRMMMHWKD